MSAFTTLTPASASSALPTASSPPGGSHDHGSGPDTKILGLALALGAVALVLIAFVVLFTLRVQRRAARADAGWRGLSSGAAPVAPRDLASRITPFGTRDANAPMRTAHRRSDGGWEFSPHSPHSTASANPFAAAADSFIDDGTLAPPTPVRPSLKERLLKQGAKRDREREPWDADGLAVPPPAYSPSASVESLGTYASGR